MTLAQSSRSATPAPRLPRTWAGLCLSGGILGLSILFTAGLTLYQGQGRAPAVSAASWLLFAGMTVLILVQSMRQRERSGLLCMRGVFLLLFSVSPLVWHSIEMRVFALTTSGLWLLLSFAAAPRGSLRGLTSAPSPSEADRRAA